MSEAGATTVLGYGCGRRTARGRTQRYFAVASAALALAMLVMAVVETTLIGHFLVDRGETFSLVCLAVMLAVAFRLHREGRLRAVFPLCLPWLLYPALTQADQLIDNLPINGMRIVVHLFLVALFAAPVLALAGLAIQYLPCGHDRELRVWTALVPGFRWIETGRVREGVGVFVAALLLLEMWVAHAYLGDIMIRLLAITGALVLLAITAGVRPGNLVSERAALGILVAGSLASASAFFVYRNMPGAYQGSPHYYNDPSRQDAAYDLQSVPRAEVADPLPPEVKLAVGAYLDVRASCLEDLLAGYYILDRNYNAAFHNALFLRSAPVLPSFRARGIEHVSAARSRCGENQRAPQGFQHLGGWPAFMDEVDRYVQFSLLRAAELELMTGKFQQTQAGLQHATHIYEGEGKALGEMLQQIVDKHSTFLASRHAEPAAGFADRARAIERAYANRIVGF